MKEKTYRFGEPYTVRATADFFVVVNYECMDFILS